MRDYTMKKMSKKQTELLQAYMQANPTQTTVDRQEMFTFADEQGFVGSTAYTMMKLLPRASRGVYMLNANVVQMPSAPSSPTVTPEKAPVAKAIDKAVGKVKSTSSQEDLAFIPSVDSTFVKWGYFTDVLKIIKSNMFYPMYVAGLSGNGKTMMIEQACAAAKREYVRVQITPETDEDDLIGGFRLLDGETVFAKGPVIKAMERGAILLIDEIDRGSNKLMALQGVLEGKPLLIKKTGEVITPASGFNVIGTANTKGQGDDAGRFISASIIDEAFLERFTITLEQPYPTAAVEKRIVNNHFDKYGAYDKESDFTDKLVNWAQAIRKTFLDGGVDEIVSTRRLCHIAQTFSIFGDRMKAIELCVNRFDDDTRSAFMDLYTKIDADVEDPTTSETEVNDGMTKQYRTNLYT